MNFLKEIIMIKAYGENFVQFKKSTFAELITELTKVEGYMIGRCDTLNGCDYWGIVDADCDENSFVNLEIGLEGNPHGVTWFDIESEFPRLIELLDAFNLQYYIGKNYVGNWGVHRHIYDESSTMNLCLLVKGNNWGTVNFHEFDNDSDFDDMSDDHIFDLHDQEFSEDTIIESVKIKDGDCYSFNTGQWHSHIVEGKKAELFLLHFKDAESVDDILEMFE
jgi:hypothetical protein